MFVSSSSPLASAWVTRIPFYKTYVMRNPEFRMAMASRLNLTLNDLHPGVWEDGVCAVCSRGGIVNFSHHAFSCDSARVHRTPRHNAIVMELAKLCGDAGKIARRNTTLGHLPLVVQPVVPTPTEQTAAAVAAEENVSEHGNFSQMIADLTLHADSANISSIIDVTIRLPKLNEQQAGAAANRGDVDKQRAYTRKYTLNGIDLIPFAVEVWGYMGSPAHEFLKNLASAKARSTGNPFPENDPLYHRSLYQYVGRISTVLMRNTGVALDGYLNKQRRQRGMLPQQQVHTNTGIT
jgi:hypothetical protein